MRILIVDDEPHIQHVLKLNLEMDGYDVVTADNGKIAIQIVDNQHFDVILLDIMMPEIDGYDVCQKIRLTDPNVGIIMISAKDTTADKISGLKIGADDYITKPFQYEELALRIQNVLKRSNSENSELDTYHFGQNTINFRTFVATSHRGNIALTQKETMLLKLLIDKSNEVVSRQQILQTVWGYDVFPNTRTIDNFILSFRKYFEEDQHNPRYFHSVRSVGYRFTPDGLKQ
ncbi:MAG: response regulator transcription factor [Saprospiraceae bacterium]